MDASTSYTDKPSHFGQLVMDNEKLRRKLHKTQQRRDHYAKLYYRTLAELDETKWELTMAKEKIHELKSQAATQHSVTTDTSVRHHPHTSTKSGSITTSPDSGASLSPGIEPVSHFVQQKPVHECTKDYKHPTSKGFVEHPDFVHQNDAWSASNQASILKQSAHEVHHRRQEEMRTQPPAFPPPPPRQFQRSYSLSQSEVLQQPTYQNGGVSSLSQDVSSLRPPFARTMSMPHKMRRTRFPNTGSAQTDIQDSSSTASQSNSSRLSAFKSVPNKFSLPVSNKSHLYYDSDVSSPSTLSRLSMSTVGVAMDSLSTEARYEALSEGQLLDLLAKISSPACRLTKLEISNSKMGQPEVMRIFCKDLLKNNSIVELSLPNNNIGYEGLCILLNTVESCSIIKELMLRNNVIGKECAEIIKQFLARTTLDSLVLTGNEIEQHGHLLNGGLPHDFAMEYDIMESSDQDSGLAQPTESDCNSQHSLSMHNFKYFNI